ncbi:hypothetical protein J2Y48_004548 [Mycoplana sp. BE70]|uniref:hypothetical protein n=1 Tax=Mycoplana sp. BE70 TaxID=2817775 RepID=UPI00285661C1|nr:hypothetical protein [Mycoplana sp. BE70]MDR6759232.1 hypothetical protein [Mycoplana sp. BE70]
MLTASIRIAGGVLAHLPTLRGIDPIESDPLASDLDRVAVDDRGATNDRLYSKSGADACEQRRADQDQLSLVHKRSLGGMPHCLARFFLLAHWPVFLMRQPGPPRHPQ